MPEPSPAVPLSLRELLVAAALSLLLGALVVGRGGWDGEVVWCATDTATVQAPWHATPRARNAELSDQGVAFYPVHRRVAERWLRGEVPHWIPDLELGLPLLANPQWGVLDPQLLGQGLLMRLGGPRLFDRGFAWLSLLRIAAAALGAYCLGRRLDLSRRGAALAGAGFALSGSLLLWLGYSVGHVVPWLPWLLLSIEGLGGRRPGLAFAGTAATAALALLAGQPEASGFVGLAGGLWTLLGSRLDRRGRRRALAALGVGLLLAAPMWVPFLEYLRHSGALLAHRMHQGERGLPDLVALGALVAFGGLLACRRGRRWTGDPRGGTGAWLELLPLWLGALGLLWVLRWRGLSILAGGGDAAFIERGSAWLAFPVLALALVALLGVRGGWRRGPAVLALGTLALLLALETPGVVDLWRWVPFLGLAAPARAACVAALFLSLAAGAALERPEPMSRAGAFGIILIVVGLLIGGARSEESPPPLAGIDAADEVVVYAERPPGRVTGELEAHLSGELRGGLALDALVLHVEPLEGSEVAREESFTRSASLSERDEVGTRRFDCGPLDLGALAPGDWRFRLELRREGVVFASRVAAVTRVERERGLGWEARLAGVVTLLLLLLGWKGGGALLLLFATVAQGTALSWSWNPAVPRAEHFPLSRTEELIAAGYPGARLLADTGILPGDTALVRGLVTVGGYDAMNVASFDGYRAFALKEGANPVLDWNASGVDLASPAFALLGVELLLFQEPRELEGWRLVAGPHDAPSESEVWIYHAEDPVPRAFCVPRIVPREEVLADLSAFDPRGVAFLEASTPLALDAPFASSRVDELSREPESLEYEVELDGEGLFVVTEQHFPGWRATVDGEETSVLRADSVFRAVRLDAGTHRVRFEYDPDSWRLGLLLGGVGLAALFAGVVLARRSACRY